MYNYLVKKIEGLKGQRQVVLDILSMRRDSYLYRYDIKRTKKLYRDLYWIDLRLSILNTIKFYF